jgi:hypothetical protein
VIRFVGDGFGIATANAVQTRDASQFAVELQTSLPGESVNGSNGTTANRVATANGHSSRAEQTQTQTQKTSIQGVRRAASRSGTDDPYARGAIRAGDLRIIDDCVGCFQRREIDGTSLLCIDCATAPRSVGIGDR